MKSKTGVILILSIISTLFITSCSMQSKLTKAAAKNKILQTVQVFPLKKTQLDKKLKLPGELLPFQSVDIFPKIESFVEAIYVDKGSVIKKGQLLIQLTAPELEDQITQANAKLESDKGVYERLNAASKTPGVISENELDVAKKAMEASNANLKALLSTKDYLQVRAPFNGIVIERNIHTGALVGPGGAGATKPLLRIQEYKRLRLVVGVPESAISGIKKGMKINFTVLAYPEKIFTAVVSRVPDYIDPSTRTEQIELDFDNFTNVLSPGMYAEVVWVIHRPTPTFIIPVQSVVNTTEQTFVVRVKNNIVEWVNVKTGNYIDDKVEIFGDLNEEDLIAYRGTDELRVGSKVDAELVSSEVIKKDTKSKTN